MYFHLSQKLLKVMVKELEPGVKEKMSLQQRNKKNNSSHIS